MMSTSKTYAVVGGDLRQAHIANRLAEQGARVYALLLENNTILDGGLVCREPADQILPKCDAVILPLPLSTDEETVSAPFSGSCLTILDCFAAIRPDTPVFAGRVSKKAYSLAKEHGIELADYLEREELAVKNAWITAESAVAIAVEETPFSILGCRCLITGHGRIAKALMRMLGAMGAQVTVAARKYGDLAEIEAQGCRAVHIAELAQHAANAQLILNTVPAKVFTHEVLAQARRDTLLIDLASKPGGVDLDAAAGLPLRTIWALSLPGKTAPISAGEIILETIQNCLHERGGI